MSDNQKRERFGRYLILDHLVDGGMAKICRARFLGEQADKVVAIKMVQPQYSKDENFKSMFMQEIKVTFGLLHPNVIQTYDYGLHKGQLFVAMEYCDGRNLKEYLEKLRDRKFVFPIEITAYIISQVCQGLHYAHTFRDKLTGQAANIIHRDISPHNIMLTYDGAIKIIDFGIAKSKTNSEATQAGTIKGKLSYLAPEYLEGLELDARYDQFAVGITLWELLCSKKLFKENNDLAVLKKIQDCNIPVPSSINPQIPKELDEIVLKALSKDRNNRYDDLDKMNRALMKFLYSKYPDFNATDLSYFAQELFRDEIKKDREKMFEFGKIDLRPYLDDLRRDSEGGGRASAEVDSSEDQEEEDVPRAREQVLDFGFDGLEDISANSLSINKPSGASKAAPGKEKDRPSLKSKTSTSTSGGKVEVTPIGTKSAAGASKDQPAKPAVVAKVATKPIVSKEANENINGEADEASAVGDSTPAPVARKSSTPVKASAGTGTGTGSSDGLKTAVSKTTKKKKDGTSTGTSSRISREDKNENKKASLPAIAAAVLILVGLGVYVFTSLSTEEHIADAPVVKKSEKQRQPAQSGEQELGEVHFINVTQRMSVYIDNKLQSPVGGVVKYPIDGIQHWARIEINGKMPYTQKFSFGGTAPVEIRLPLANPSDSESSVRLEDAFDVSINITKCKSGEYTYTIANELRIEKIEFQKNQDGENLETYLKYPIPMLGRQPKGLPVTFTVEIKKSSSDFPETKSVTITNENLNEGINLCD